MTATPAGAVRPPRGWEVQALILLVAIGTAAVLSMIYLASDLVVRAYLQSDGRTGLSPLVETILDNADGVDSTSTLVVIAYIGGLAWWQARTRVLLRAAGDPTGKAGRHWAVRMWYIALIAAIVIRYGTPAAKESTDEMATALAWDATLKGVRLLGLAFLMVGVWQIREQVLRQLTAAHVARQLEALKPGPPTATTVRDDLPRTDDDFWQQVGRLAAESGADLALLETTDSVIRRWMLVPSTGDLAGFRATLRTGAVVTVFAEPPAAADATDFIPAAADEYFGLIEHSKTGALWFQAVTPDRIPAFLGFARSARRWALYPADSPTALTAVVQSGNLQPT